MLRLAPRGEIAVPMWGLEDCICPMSRHTTLPLGVDNNLASTRGQMGFLPKRP